MKKLSLLLLTVFTIGMAAACGCGSSKISNSYDEKANEPSAQIQEVEIAAEENEQKNPRCPECHDREKHDGKFPTPRRPHKWHGKKIPNPKSAYKK